MKCERGAALVIALLAVALLCAFGFSLAMVMSTETRIAGSFAAARQVRYAADGALEIAAQELTGVSDWNLLLAGRVLSAFVDGAPDGTRRVSGVVLDLSQITGLANSESRPWGPNNPYWHPFAFGPLGAAAYVIVWVADDPAENDGDPLQDGGGEHNPGAGIVALRAEAFGVAGAHRVVEATARRTIDASGVPAIRMLSWQEIR
jgi:hypothetical protein